MFSNCKVVVSETFGIRASVEMEFGHCLLFQGLPQSEHIKDVRSALNTVVCCCCVCVWGGGGGVHARVCVSNAHDQSVVSCFLVFVFCFFKFSS